MSDEVHETIRRDGEPRHRLRVWAPDEAWTQENGRPGWASFTIWEVEGWQDDDTPLFTRADTLQVAGTEVEAEALTVAHGTVKWDGCCNYEVGSPQVMLHACGPKDLEYLAAALRRAYDLALTMVGDPDA